MPALQEIDDRGSLRAWLDGWPRRGGRSKADAVEMRTALAMRAAARVLPLVWLAQSGGRRDDPLDPMAWRDASDTEAQERLSHTLSVMRAVLLAQVASERHDAALLARAEAAEAATRSFVNRSSSSFGYAAAAAAFAARSARGRSSAACANAVASASSAYGDFAYASGADTGAIWGCLRSDIALIEDEAALAAAPLWPDAPRPDLMRAIRIMERDLETVGETGFWADWHRALLDPAAAEGSPGPDALREIALIEPDVWERGPPIVMAMIDWIVTRHRSLDEATGANPLALRVERRNSGRLEAHPIEARDLSAIVDDTRRALREFKRRCKAGSGNLGPAIAAACDRDIEELRRRLPRVKTDARELHRLLEETAGSLRHIAEVEGFASDERIDRLIGNLQKREEDVCVAAPEVMEEVRARLAVRVQLFTAAQTRAATRLSVGMFADSAGVLRGLIARAVLVVNDPDMAEADKQAAWTFLLGALPRGARAMNAADQDGSDPAAGGAVEALVSGADKIAKLDRGVDVLQEAVAEGGPWVAEFWTQLTSGNLWAG